MVLHSEFSFKTHCFMKAYVDFNRMADPFDFYYVMSCYESIRNLSGPVGERQGVDRPQGPRMVTERVNPFIWDLGCDCIPHRARLSPVCRKGVLGAQDGTYTLWGGIQLTISLPRTLSWSPLTKLRPDSMLLFICSLEVSDGKAIGPRLFSLLVVRRILSGYFNLES